MIIDFGEGINFYFSINLTQVCFDWIETTYNYFTLQVINQYSFYMEIKCLTIKESYLITVDCKGTTTVEYKLYGLYNVKT